jgi:hypothetical protein
MLFPQHVNECLNVNIKKNCGMACRSDNLIYLPEMKNILEESATFGIGYLARIRRSQWPDEIRKITFVKSHIPSYHE